MIQVTLQGNVADAVTEQHAPPQYGLGPFSLREWLLMGVWLVSMVLSFLPAAGNPWTIGFGWLLSLIVPTVAIFLITLRRFSPEGIRRVGSLGIDQFASVAFSVAAVVWFDTTIRSMWAASVFDTREPLLWGALVIALLMLAGVVLTVFAPFIPGIRDDFQYREAVPSQPQARPLRPLTKRPEATAPAVEPTTQYGYGYQPTPAAAHVAGAPSMGDYGLVRSTHPDAAESPAATDAPAAPSAEDADDVSDQTRVNAATKAADADTVVPPDAGSGDTPPVSQAFWIVVPTDRWVSNENGEPLFAIGPNAWSLVLEDRGTYYVMRDDDGRVGYLHDITGVRRG